MDEDAVSPMDEAITLDRLVTSKVLTQDGDGVQFADPFLERADSIRLDLDSDRSTIRSRLEAVIENGELVNTFLDVADHDLIPVAAYLALRERLDVPEANGVQLLAALDQFLRGPPEVSGAPDPFLPVRGDLLPPLITVAQRGIVYFWRHDCDPCDLVRGDFETYFETTPPDMTLLAVYGPNWVDESREYEVGMAPTILFLRDGRIDARLVGAFPPKALENEIEKVRELSGSA